VYGVHQIDKVNIVLLLTYSGFVNTEV